jgi:hypothetical protein
VTDIESDFVFGRIRGGGGASAELALVLGVLVGGFVAKCIGTGSGMPPALKFTRPRFASASIT